jgi:hypothetical protein
MRGATSPEEPRAAPLALAVLREREGRVGAALEDPPDRELAGGAEVDEPQHIQHPRRSPGID